jgi:hypothetical protein
MMDLLEAAGVLVACIAIAGVAALAIYGTISAIGWLIWGQK